jgi:hypothetical protein
MTAARQNAGARALQRAADDRGQRSKGHSGHKATLAAAPRQLGASSALAAEAWELATTGHATGGRAYLLPQLGGWQWAAIVEPPDRARTSAVLLTIAPDGGRYLERFGRPDGAWADLERMTADALGDEAARTPADFAPFLRMSAPDAAADLEETARPLDPVPEWLTGWGGAPVVDTPAPAEAVPAQAPLPWVAAASAPEPIAGPEPEPTPAWRPAEWFANWPHALLPRALAAAPPARESVSDLPTVTRRRAPWLRVARWSHRQLAAGIGPWMAERPPVLELPRLVQLQVND